MRGRTAEDLSLLELLDPVAEAAGYEIVRLRLMGSGRSEGGRRLQIMAELPDGGMEIEDCVALSRAISQVLDAADPVSGEYNLEVSSPGIDRPLTRLKDFDTYQGLEAKVELARLVDGRKRFRGRLAGTDGQDVLIVEEGAAEPARVPFAQFEDAKLVLNDELLQRGAAEREARLAHSQSQEQDA